MEIQIQIEKNLVTEEVIGTEVSEESNPDSEPIPAYNLPYVEASLKNAT